MPLRGIIKGCSILPNVALNMALKNGESEAPMTKSKNGATGTQLLDRAVAMLNFWGRRARPEPELSILANS